MGSRGSEEEIDRSPTHRCSRRAAHLVCGDLNVCLAPPAAERQTVSQPQHQLKFGRTGQRYTACHGGTWCKRKKQSEPCLIAYQTTAVSTTFYITSTLSRLSSKGKPT